MTARIDHSGAANEPAQEVVLTDGRRVRIRPVRASDLAIHTAFVGKLSFQTGYMRLLSPRKPQADELRRMTDVDPARELALIATASTSGVEVEEIGVARYIRGDTPETADQAEFAVVIADAWQRCGLAETLLRLLIDAARKAGIKRLADVTMYDNIAMLSLARKLGFQTRRVVGDGNVTRILLDLANLKH